MKKYHRHNKQVRLELKEHEEPRVYQHFLSVRFRQLKQQYDLKVHEADLVETRLKQSTHHHQLEEIKALEQSIGKRGGIHL